MSEEQLKAFLKAVKADAGLQEKLKAADCGDNMMIVPGEAVVQIAKDEGFVISVEELSKLQDQLELSEEELQSISGGGWMGMGANLLGGVQTGIAANRMGVNLGNQGAGPFAIGAMVAQNNKW